MTLEEIRAKRQEIHARIREARKAIDHAGVDLVHLQQECSHPNKRSYTDMSGTPCSTCPDCGGDW